MYCWSNMIKYHCYLSPVSAQAVSMFSSALSTTVPSFVSNLGNNQQIGQRLYYSSYSHSYPAILYSVLCPLVCYPSPEQPGGLDVPLQLCLELV